MNWTSIRNFYFISKPKQTRCWWVLAREIAIIIRCMRASGNVRAHDKLNSCFMLRALSSASRARFVAASLHIVKTVNYYCEHGAIRVKGTYVEFIGKSTEPEEMNDDWTDSFWIYDGNYDRHSRHFFSIALLLCHLCTSRFVARYCVQIARQAQKNSLAESVSPVSFSILKR